MSTFIGDGIDIAVRQGFAPQQKELDWCFLAPHDLVAVATRELIAQYPDDAPLGSFPLIEDSHRLWTALLESAVIQNEVKMYMVNHTSLSLDAARREQGVALVPRCYLDPKDDQMLTQMRSISEPEGRGFFFGFGQRDDKTPQQ